MGSAEVFIGGLTPNAGRTGGMGTGASRQVTGGLAGVFSITAGGAAWVNTPASFADLIDGGIVARDDRVCSARRASESLQTFNFAALNPRMPGNAIKPNKPRTSTAPVLPATDTSAVLIA